MNANSTEDIKAALEGRDLRDQRAQVTLRLPASVLEAVRSDAVSRGLTVTDIVTERLSHEVIRLSSPSAVRAQPLNATGYRIASAVDAIRSGDADAALANLDAARTVIAGELAKLKTDYDADIGTHIDIGLPDDWSGH
jgi:hypothetical protein